MTSKEEKAYLLGQQMVYRELIRLGMNGMDTRTKEDKELVAEARATYILGEVKIKLKHLCEFASLEFDPNLHPADIIEGCIRFLSTGCTPE